MGRKQKPRDEYTVIVVALFLIVAVYLFWHHRKQSGLNSAASAARTKNSAQGNESGASDSLKTKNKVKNGDNPSASTSAKAVRVDSTPGCTEKEASRTLEVSAKQALRLMKGEKAEVLLVSSKAPCLKEKANVDIEAVYADESTFAPYLKEPRGPAKIEKIREVDFESLPKKLRKLLKKTNGKKYRIHLLNERAQVGDNRGFIVTLSQTPSLERPSPFYPSQNPVGTVLDANAVRVKIQAGALLLDVRNAKQYALGSIPKAINVPSESVKKLRPSALPSSEIAQLTPISPEEMLKLRNLIKNSTRELIVFDNGAPEFLAYNLVTYLNSQGLSHLSWFAGGLNQWNGQDYLTPSSAPGARTIKASEAETLIKDAFILDTRAKEHFKHHHPEGAEHVFFREIVDKRGYPVNHVAQPNLSTLSQGGEGFLGSKIDKVNKDRTVIVLGQDEYDWRSFKAASYLGLSGFKKVYWLRDGFRAWKYASIVNHDVFKIVNKKSEHGHSDDDDDDETSKDAGKISANTKSSEQKANSVAPAPFVPRTNLTPQPAANLKARQSQPSHAGTQTIVPAGQSLKTRAVRPPRSN